MYHTVSTRDFLFPKIDTKPRPSASCDVENSVISSNKTLWFDRLAYFILNSDEDTFRLILESKFNIKNNYENRRYVLEEVMEYVKHIPNSERETILDDIYSIL